MSYHIQYIYITIIKIVVKYFSYEDMNNIQKFSIKLEVRNSKHELSMEIDFSFFLVTNFKCPIVNKRQAYSVESITQMMKSVVHVKQYGRKRK